MQNTAYLLAATLLAVPVAVRAEIVLSSNDGHTVQDDQKVLVAPKDPHPDTVSVIDVKKASVLRTVAVGAYPAALAVDTGSRHAFIANQDGDSLSLLNLGG